MLRTVSLVALILIVASPTAAELREVTVHPETPRRGEPVSITVFGGFTDGCWAFDRVEWSVACQGVTVDVYAVDLWVPGSACPTVMVDYETEAQLGPLKASTYQLHVVEHRSSLRSLPLQSMDDEFTVGLGVPKVSRSWSRVKGSYQD